MDPVQIVITIDESGVTCDTPLSHYEIVFWLEAVKRIVLEESLSVGDDSEPSE